MRNLKVILVALVLFAGTLSSFATVDPVVTSKKTTNEIAKLLNDPGFFVDDSINAYVTFIINKNDEVVVLSVDCDTRSVCRFIKSRLNYNKLGTNLEKGQIYKVPIRIVKES